MNSQQVIFEDLGDMAYQQAWDYQEQLLQENVRRKSKANDLVSTGFGLELPDDLKTQHHLLFVEHPPVYTLGKSGRPENVLLTTDELQEKGISFFQTNRGGDITFHGPQQLVGYPILDLELFYRDIGKYLRNIEETIILTLAEYGLQGERSKGETGVWLDPNTPGRERKICAIGVRSSRWITMHGFALNVNTDLDYFNHIIPCGIQDKQVTSLKRELGRDLNMNEVKEIVKKSFEKVFDVKLVTGN